MSQIQNYVKALENEVELKLSGFQTNFVEVEPKNESEHEYKLQPSLKTQANFIDIVQQLRKNFKTNQGCYQIPESEVPKTKLRDENFLTIVKFREVKNKDGDEKSYFITFNKSVKSKHLICVAPHITQEVLELLALEQIQKSELTNIHVLRENIDRYDEGKRLQIPSFLKNLFQNENWNLPTFETQTIRDEDYLVLTDANRKGTNEQREFVNKALSTPDIAILNGPPGSGKTTCIVELLYQLLLRQKRVLLTASTNVAVDNILEKLQERLNDFCTKRYGDSDNERISFNGKKFLLGKNFCTLESKKWKNRLESVRNPHLQELREVLDSKQNEDLWAILEASAPIVAGTTFGVAHTEIQKCFITPAQNLEPPFDYLIIDEASKTTIQEFLPAAILCKRWIVIGDIKQLPPYVDTDDLAYNLQMVYPENSENKKEFTAASDSLLISRSSGNRQVCILVEKESDYDTYLYKKYGKANDVLAADADNEEDAENLPYASIILGSCSSFDRLQNFLSPRITTVRPARDEQTGRILHEAEMQKWISLVRNNREKILKRFNENYPREWHDEMSWRMVRLFEERDNIINTHADIRVSLKKEIESLIPQSQMEYCKKNLADFQQIYLPSCLELFLRGFGEDRSAALFRGIPPEFLDSRMTTLSYQHRSHPEIAQIASEEFYEGKAMKSEHMQGKREWDYQRYGNAHNFFADIKGKCDFRNCNKKEIKWIADELKAFKKFAKKHSKKEYSVAVLSFYKEQAEKLKIKCKEIFNGAKNVHYEAGSVDSFQGHEADIVFLSYSNSHPTCFLEVPNRLNVAITRARYMMVHVGNWNAMSKAQGALGRIVQKLKNFRQTFN